MATAPWDTSRYYELMEKRRAGSLTPEEHEELLHLTDVAEAIQAQRVQDLAELAQLGGTPLSLLMEELGLQPADAKRHERQASIEAINRAYEEEPPTTEEKELLQGICVKQRKLLETED
jgi:hypothetical protein